MAILVTGALMGLVPLTTAVSRPGSTHLPPQAPSCEGSAHFPPLAQLLNTSPSRTPPDSAHTNWPYYPKA